MLMIEEESGEKDFTIAKNKPTTLTIVQDFPKKTPDQKGSSINMVQADSHNVNFVDASDKLTTLTIVQDFPKK